MNWIYWAIVAAGILHVVEEYFYPGGFLEMVKRLNPRYAAGFSIPFAVIFNGLFILLCLAAALLADTCPFFSLSVAGLLGVNALVHSGVAVRGRAYAPGLVSGWLLYVPLAAVAYVQAVASGRFTTGQLIGSFLLGVLYHVMPVAFLVVRRRQ